MARLSFRSWDQSGKLIDRKGSLSMAMSSKPLTIKHISTGSDRLLVRHLLCAHDGQLRPKEHQAKDLGRYKKFLCNDSKVSRDAFSPQALTNFVFSEPFRLQRSRVSLQLLQNINA